MRWLVMLGVVLASTQALADPLRAEVLASPRADAVKQTASLTLKMTAAASAATAVGIWFAATQKEARDVRGAGATAQWAALPGAVAVAATLAALGLDGTF